MVQPLLKALEGSSEKLLPMIAWILVKDNQFLIGNDESPFGYVAEFFGRYAERLSFVEEIATGWFGDDLSSLAHFFSQSNIIWPKGLVAARYLVCKKWAEQYLLGNE